MDKYGKRFKQAYELYHFGAWKKVSGVYLSLSFIISRQDKEKYAGFWKHTLRELEIAFN